MIMPADRPNTRTDLTSADICTREEEHSVAVDTSTTRSVKCFLVGEDEGRNGAT